MREISNSRHQSTESKKFYKDRAAAKRERKGRINHARVLRGEMQYSDDHLKRTGTFVLGTSEVLFGGKVIGHARRIMMTPIIDTATDLGLRPMTTPMSIDMKIDLDGMTVPQLLEHAKLFGLKVTTKMTKAKLIEVIRAAG